MVDGITRDRQERKRCAQCHGSTIFLVTETRNDEGQWEETRVRRNCGHRPDGDPTPMR